MQAKLCGKDWTAFVVPASSLMAEVDREWRERASGLLRAELGRRNLSYVDLAERLRAIGIMDTPKNLSNKIARGMFTAAFLLQCMEAIGCQSIRLSDK
jgi:hypothetical protein